MKTNPALEAEIRGLKTELDLLLAEPVLTQSQRKRADLMLAKLSLLRGQKTEAAETLAEREQRAAFKAFLTGAPDAEFRGDLLAGGQTISWTQGPEGGYLVPQAFASFVREGMAQTDPLLDPDVANVVQEDGYKLPPLLVPGWDLSAISAVLVNEGAQHNSDAVPAVTGKLLGKFLYRLTLGASFEWNDDERAFAAAEQALGRAFGIGMARGIDLINGDGSTGPAGLLTGASDSGVTTAAAGVISLDDIQNVYFSLNRAYRVSPKCAWVMADSVYEMVRKSKDSSGRPLLSVERDGELLMGKRVLVAPSLSGAAGAKGIIFGDLSAFVVHTSSLYLRRRLQIPGYVENGKYAFTGLMMVDSAVQAPGSVKPVVYATLHV